MLILFDIDGTLLHSNGCGKAATERAMQDVFGTVGGLAQFQFGGKTDWQMLLETLHGLIPATDIQAKLADYDRVLAHHLAQIIADFNVQPCRGAPELLDLCVRDPEITVGLLTANMPAAASVKLNTAGYDPDVFELGVFGSEAISRNDLPALALERLHQVKQLRYQPDQVVIIGDTPDDIACARALGARVIAVATGRNASDTLAQHTPDLLLPDLAEPQRVYARIKGWG